MLGLLLARAGVQVVVLEKYPDFHRDFRGDTIHASTLQVLDELGLMPAFDRLPHQPTRTVAMMTDDGMVTLGDFSRLPGAFQYLSMVPQWDFLAFLTAEAAKYPAFTLIRPAEVTELIVERDVVRGVRYETAGGTHELRAALTVACDGRHSVGPGRGRPGVKEYGVPLDVLWFRIPKGTGDPAGSFARLGPGRLFPVIDRGVLLAGRGDHAEGQLRRRCGPPGSRPSAPTWTGGCRSPPTGSTRRCGAGTTPASSRCG